MYDFTVGPQISTVHVKRDLLVTSATLQCASKIRRPLKEASFFSKDLTHKTKIDRRKDSAVATVYLQGTLVVSMNRPKYVMLDR